MTARRLIAYSAAGFLFLLLLFAWSPDASADPIVTNPIVPPVPGINVGGGVGEAGGPGIIGAVPNLTPAQASIFLCPGVGGAANVVGFGGGYCDFDFAPVQLTGATFGVMHIHCEWGGGNPFVEMWNCWRVWPGQPDHPAHPDPDIVPDGMGVPWAINGPNPADQWPPPGLAPAAALIPPPTPPEPPLPPAPPPPPPGFPPWDLPTGPPPGPPPP
jgi:hypothetical protein